MRLGMQPRKSWLSLFFPVTPRVINVFTRLLSVHCSVPWAACQSNTSHSESVHNIKHCSKILEQSLNDSLIGHIWKARSLLQREKNNLTLRTHSLTAFTEPPSLSVLLSRVFGVLLLWTWVCVVHSVNIVLLLISPAGVWVESGVVQGSLERKLVQGSGWSAHDDSN